MLPRFPSTSASCPLPNDLDNQFLAQAQGFLRRRERHEVPSEAEIQAWNRFYSEYDSHVRHFALACGLHGVDAEDCSQDAWIEVIRQLPAFHSDGTQGGLCCWLHKIVHGKAVDLHRYQKRHPAKHLLPASEASLDSKEASPVAHYEQHRRQEAVQRIMAILREKVSTLSYCAFSMHCVDKKTIKNIAAELNTTQRIVRRRISKAKQRFRVLCEQGVDNDLFID